MEKMNYKRIYIKWISQRLEKLEMLVESKTSYIPIYRENLKLKHDAHLQALETIEKKNLDQLSFVLKSKEDRIRALKSNKEEQLNKSYYWKERKIKHSLKKAYDANHEEILIKALARHEYDSNQLSDLKLKKMSNFEKGLNDQKLKLSKTISETDFKVEQEKSLKLLNEKTETLKRIRELKTNHLIQQTDKHVEKLNQKILELKDILSKYDIELRKNEIKTLEALKKDQSQDALKSIMIDHLESKTLMRDPDSNVHLAISHLTMTFSGLKAVDDLSFHVKKGSIFGLIGPNGAGKTTVFNCITQFYKPKSGEIFFRNNKNEVISLLDYPVHHIIKQGIVRTFQNVELIWELNILDNMLVGAHTLYKSGFFTQLLHLPKLKREEEVIRKKAHDILTKLGLIQYKDFYPLGLPYGILKKIELARTLMTDPKLIILDEPAAGLNDFETKALAKTIREINKNYGCTIFLVEHDMELVMDICDEICAISFGKKLAIGTPKEIQNHPLVREAYLGGE